MTAEKSKAPEVKIFRKPTFAESVIVALALFVPIVVGNILLHYHIILMLVVAAILAGIMSLRVGWRWKEMQEGIIKMLDGAMPCVFILFLIGMVVGSFIFSGSIPMLIYYGMKLMSPRMLAPSALVICSVLSIATGSSWTSAGTAGLALMGIAIGMDVPLPPVLGAIVAGAVIGDKLSPLSDTTNLAAMSTGVYIYDHIWSMMWTTVPAFIIAFAIYTIYSMMNLPLNTATSENFVLLVQNLDAIFNWNVALLIPFVIMIGGAVLKYPPVPCMLAGAFSAVLLGVFVQGFSMSNGIASLMSGFNTSMIARAGVDAANLPPNVIKLLHRGGVFSMFYTICIVFSAYSYTGIAHNAGYFDVLMEKMISQNASRGKTVLIAVISGLFLTVFGGISYIPIVMLGTLFKKPYLRHNLDLRCLSRTCEDTGTMTISIVPWSSSGVYYFGIFGVSVATFAPWVIIPFISPLLAVFYGYTGIGMKTLPQEESQRKLAELEAEEVAA